MREAARWRRSQLPLVAVTLGLVACAGGEPRREEADRRILGKPLDAAVALFGPSFESRPGEGGETRHEWLVVEEYLVSGGTDPPTLGVSRRGTGTYSGGKRRAPRVVTERCRVTVTTGADGLVRGWNADGAECTNVLRARLR